MRLLILAAALAACRSAAPPTPAASPAPAPALCAGTSVLARPVSSWYPAPAPDLPCEPVPGRAGWVSERRPAQRLTETAAQDAAQGDTARPPARVVVALSARGRPLRPAERARLVALSGPEAELHALDGASIDAAGGRGVLEALATRTGPTTHVRLALFGASAAGGEPFGCLPLADGCAPLGPLQARFAALPAASRAVVVEGGEPALAVALFADLGTAVAAFADDAAGRRAARRFWEQRGDPDGDGALALRERFAAADPPEASARFLDVTGTITWRDSAARPRRTSEIVVPRDLAQVVRVAQELQAGEYLALYVAIRECVDCELFDRRRFWNTAAARPGIRYAAFRDSRSVVEALGRETSVVEPTIAYYDRSGRLIGFADDPGRVLGSLPAALVPAEKRRAVYDAWLLGDDLERVKAAAAAIVRLEGGHAEALIGLARRVHEDSDPSLIMAVMAALTRGKWAGAAAAPEVLSHLDHPDDPVRMAVLDAMLSIQADPDDVLCPVISVIPDRNPEIRERVRRLLFTFLRRVGPGVHAMATLVEHEDQAVRRAAVEAFADLNAGERAAPAVPALTRMYLSDDPLETRRLALLGLARAGGSVAAALPDLAPFLVGEPDPESRALLAEIAGHAGAAGACARPGLELLAREDVEMVRRKARVALAEIDAALHPEEPEEEEEE